MTNRRDTCCFSSGTDATYVRTSAIRGKERLDAAEAMALRRFVVTDAGEAPGESWKPHKTTMWLKDVYIYIYLFKEKHIYNDIDQQTDFQTNKLGN